MDRKFLLKSGEKLTISINRKSKSESQVSPRIAEPSKGLIKPRKNNDYPKRRLQKNSYINFYDLGQIWNPVTMKFDSISTQIIQPPRSDNQLILDAEYFNSERFAKVLDVPNSIDKSLWKTKFRRLDKITGKDYRIEVSNAVADKTFYLKDDEPEWTEKGLKTTEDIKKTGLQILSREMIFENSSSQGYYEGSLFNLISLQTGREDYINKVTETPEFNKPNVTLNFSGTVDIFLVPAFNYSFGYIDVIISEDDGTENLIRQVLNNFLQTYPRERVFDSDNLNYRKATSGYASELHPEEYQAFLDATTLAKSFNGARLSQYVAIDDTSYHLQPLDKFPYYRLPYGSDVRFSVSLLPNYENELHAIIAIINQSGKWYYVWSQFRNITA